MSQDALYTPAGPFYSKNSTKNSLRHKNAEFSRRGAKTRGDSHSFPAMDGGAARKTSVRDLASPPDRCHRAHLPQRLVRT